MMCIIKIGYQSFLLPNEKGLSTILTALSKAHTVKNDLRYEDGGIILDGAPKISSEMLPNFKFVKRSNAPEIEAELLPPERQALTGSRRRALTPGRLCLEGGA
jgi:hypothetical protein